MKKYLTVNHILLAVAIIIAIILILSYFKKGNEGLSDKDKAILAADKQAFDAMQGQRDTYKLLSEHYAQDYQNLRTQDSLTTIRLTQSEQYYQKLFNDQLKKIPINIAAISNSDTAIIAAFKRFN